MSENEDLDTNLKEYDDSLNYYTFCSNLSDKLNDDSDKDNYAIFNSSFCCLEPLQRRYFICFYMLKRIFISFKKNYFS